MFCFVDTHGSPILFRTETEKEWMERGGGDGGRNVRRGENENMVEMQNK